MFYGFACAFVLKLKHIHIESTASADLKTNEVNIKKAALTGVLMIADLDASESKRLTSRFLRRG